MTTKSDYFTDGLYRILHRFRFTVVENYGKMLADNDTTNLWSWLLFPKDYKWYNGEEYVDTGKDLSVNTWFVLGYWMNSLADGDAYINSDLADSDTYRVDPTIGLSSFQPIQASRFRVGDTFHDYILIMNFTANEPTHIDWGSSETPLETPAKLFGAGFNGSNPVVHLYWKTNLTDITLFEVQNSTDKVSWDYLGFNTIAEYHDFQVVNGIERYYRVRACNLTGALWLNSTWTDIDFETVYFIGAVGDGVNIPAINEIVFNTTIAETVCEIYGDFSDVEGLSGYIFWNNATSAPGGVNSSFTALTGVSNSTLEVVTLPVSGAHFGVKYYVNDTDDNWGVDTLTMFPAAAEAADTIIMGASGIFWIIGIILVPIVAYMAKKG